MNRFDNGHTAAPRPHFLDPPPQPQPRPSLILGGAGLLLTMTATAIGTGLWLGLAGAIAWRVFRGLLARNDGQGRRFAMAERPNLATPRSAQAHSVWGLT